MVDADDLISNGTPQWGAIASLFVGSLVFAWYDAVITLLTALFTVPTRIVGGLLGGTADVIVTVLEAPGESIQTAFAVAATEIESLGLGPLALVAALLVIAGTWWLAERLGDSIGGS
jgi:hypothetical protein